MLERRMMGDVPRTPHTVLRSADGRLRYEHCLTQRGFDGAYSILYHVRPPHAQAESGNASVDVRPRLLPEDRLAKRHFRTARLDRHAAEVPLLVNDDVELSIATPSSDAYASEGDGDALFFVLEGAGVLRSWFGDLTVDVHDYVFVPRGVPYRFVPASAPLRALRLGFPHGLGIPAAYRNPLGQLRMDAPIGHRDFRHPAFVGPLDEGLRELRVRRHGRVHAFVLAESPLDVVGWDGAVYPWALPIRAFRPRVGKTHLPPTVHATFESRGVLVSSFVPRPLDFDPDAIPCPYPHSSVDCDEAIFYASGDFISRRAIESGSLTLHPAGLPHGPSPGAYEASLGQTHADEVAVMLDAFAPLARTEATLGIEDDAYHASYVGSSRRG